MTLLFTRLGDLPLTKALKPVMPFFCSPCSLKCFFEELCWRFLIILSKSFLFARIEIQAQSLKYTEQPLEAARANKNADWKSLCINAERP